jgi:hypothetical protein
VFLLIFGGALGSGATNPVVDYNRYLFPDSTADGTVTSRLAEASPVSSLTDRLVSDPSPASS